MFLVKIGKFYNEIYTENQENWLSRLTAADIGLEPTTEVSYV